MKRFYSSNIEGDTALLKDSERDHCIRVLRTREGEPIEVMDGQGRLYRGILRSSDRSTAVVGLEGEVLTRPRQNAPVIACAIPKNHSRWELILEKTVEIGVESIIPIICHRSEKKHIRRERSEQIVLSAFKQSGHYYLPRLEEPVKLADLIKGRSGIDEEKFIAYCGEIEKSFLGSLHSPGRQGIILIGPEGDFTEEEVSLAGKNGFEAISLGASRLRVETAAIVACSIIQSVEQSA